MSIAYEGSTLTVVVNPAAGHGRRPSYFPASPRPGGGAAGRHVKVVRASSWQERQRTAARWSRTLVRVSTPAGATRCW